MPSTAPTYNENPTFADPIPQGFSGTGYGEALVGLRLTLDQRNRTDYLKNLGKCMNPRTPDKIHEYTVLTGAQSARRGEMGRITRNFCGTKQCRNPDRIWGPPGTFQHIPVPIRDQRELAVRYAFWLESMGRMTLAAKIRHHFLENQSTQREFDSSPVRPRRASDDDDREVQSSPTKPRKRKTTAAHSTTRSKVAKFSNADEKKPISSDAESESEVEIVEVKLVGTRSISGHSTTPFVSAGPSNLKIHQPSGSHAKKSVEDRSFTTEDLIAACRRLEEEVMDVFVDEDLKAAIESLKETLDLFVE
ncbi:hypothetical protein F5878DRAFT_645996 [Lentinula raphanica]|uniref:Uncharacterized protein n=1 Tax=Lentinula raphanica TaxID=153919 RepID=A0AA38NZB3_9AGAR|nr:hypothetical protein F5878DRAFT_645996 [Lentinula raphanica]